MYLLISTRVTVHNLAEYAALSLVEELGRNNEDREIEAKDLLR